MYTDILKETKIIVIILRAAPVVTVARITIITAWDIFRSIAMVMAVPILTSISMKTTMIAAVAMTMQPRSLTTIMKSTRTMNEAVATSIITMSTRMMNAAVVMSMKSMSTMNAAVVMSMMSMDMMNAAAAMSMSTIMSMCPVIQRIVNARFAILMRNIAISVAKA